MMPDLPNTLEINSREQYVELRDTFEVIFMNMKIAEPATYLDKLYYIIKKSEFLNEFKDRCKEYFPKYPKRMSAWYAHAVINPLEDEKQRATETFAVINQFADDKITAQLASHTFDHISIQELKEKLLWLDKKESVSTVSFKFAAAFYQYAQKFDDASYLFDTLSDYPENKQFYMIEELVSKEWFSPERYQHLFSYLSKNSNKKDFYNMILEKETNIDCLESLTPTLLDLMTKRTFTEKTLQFAFSKSTEKNQYLIENLVTNEQEANKAIDYAMKYECGKDINSTIGFINYNLVNHFNDINTLDSNQVCLIISRCFIQRVTNSQFCDLIVNLLDIIKKGDNELYKEVNKKINSDESFYIYEFDGRDRTVTFGTPEFKGFLSEVLFEKLNGELDNKPIVKKIKI
jgi:hypothetical protein